MKTLPVAAVGALAYILLGLNHGLSIYDEAIPVVAATRILDGDLPYRDFWVIYPPGQLYLLAALFKTVGPTLIVSRLAAAAALFTSCLLMYGMARQLHLPTRLALLAAGLWTAVTGAIEGATLGTGVLSALALGMGSASLLLRFANEPGRRWPVLSGGALGVAFLFRHDIAACLLAVETAFLVSTKWSRNRRSGDRGALAAFLAAAALPGVLTVGALLAAGLPARDLVDGLVFYPFTGYPAARSLPLPALVPSVEPLRDGRMSMVQYAGALRGGLRFYFPVVVLVLTPTTLIARRQGTARLPLFMCMVLAALLPYAWVRSDVPHIVPAWFPALLLFAWLLHQLPARGAGRAVGLTVGGAWSLVFLWGAVAVKAGMLWMMLWGPPGLALDPPRGAHILVPPSRVPLRDAVRYVRAVVPPDERLFVGNTHHDSLVLNDVMFYFLASRRSATRYHELAPGVATTAEAQALIVQELARYRVRHVVLREDPGYVPARAGGTRVLDDFLREKFEPVEAFGNYHVWRRREGVR